MKLLYFRIYEAIRIILNGGIYKRVIERELNPSVIDTVLDVGCGTGIYSLIIPGKYLGIDTNRGIIEYARKKYQTSQKRFYVGRLESLVNQNKIKEIDKAIVINVLHHLNQKEVSSLLASLNTLVKQKVIIVDTDKTGANWFQKLFYLFDDGHHMRSLQMLHHIISTHLNIRKEYIFFPPTYTVRLCLFDCQPQMQGS